MSDNAVQPLRHEPSVQDSPSFVGDYLLYLLAAVSDRASGQFHDHVRLDGLRVPEWRVLACLSDEDGAMVTELARLSLLEQSRLTRIIDQMAAKGLVSRGADPADARRVRVFLTRHGRALATRLVDDAQAHEKGLLALLTEQEAAVLKPVLKALLARLEDDQR
ncbi:MAG: MarR family winged helix-turn-helix transcriptional regulator [Aestuariivita sp.]|uniref:MarR family winged helix-turn-helix transcriptional regulator n=1 Tax=Aestuariivita sp. TaxID=1872407 RepID=UPI003BAFCDCB